jgi:hypothetical protein
MDYGLSCADNKDYFINKCNYDQAGILLQQIYGVLNPKNKGELSGKLVAFNQGEFTFPESPGSYSMAETGYVYVPAVCAAQQPCRVHVALHGCKQNFDAVGDRYTRHAGYNEWADTNQMIILYPQTIAGNPLTDFGTPLNPFGCWDWWGYTNFNYAVKAGRQVTTIKTMLDRLTSANVQSREASPTNVAATSDVVVNDVSDTGRPRSLETIGRCPDLCRLSSDQQQQLCRGLRLRFRAKLWRYGLTPAVLRLQGDALPRSAVRRTKFTSPDGRRVRPCRCDQPGTCLVP